jgi:hypothetical protein
MAHFAKLDNNDIVQQVIVVNNNELLDENGYESEAKGIQFCESLFGGIWVQTSYNGSFRKNFAGIGYKYDRQRLAFIPPQPYPSWTMNDDTFQWESPVAHPNDGNMYEWNEETQSWVAI